MTREGERDEDDKVGQKFGPLEIMAATFRLFLQPRMPASAGSLCVSFIRKLNEIVLKFWLKPCWPTRTHKHTHEKTVENVTESGHKINLSNDIF